MRARYLLYNAGIVGLAIALIVAGSARSEEAAQTAPAFDQLGRQFGAEVRPLLTRFCLDCHSTEKAKGELDLERFAGLADVRGDLEVWRHVIAQIEDGEMPPRKEPQPSDAERAALLAWVRATIDAEIRSRAGDPGRVVLRRLNNAEYDRTVRDLTGVELRPSRQFPVDGAAGEGFTNTGQALVMSPGLLTKYLDAAKSIAEHAVLEPDGIRFSPSTTRRDWNDESIARVQEFYRRFSPDGRLHVEPYLAATLRHRAALRTGQTTTADIAEREKLSPFYLRTLWHALNDDTPSPLLDPIRAAWRRPDADAGALARRIDALRALTWKFNVVGSYMADVWQEPVTPGVDRTATLRRKIDVPANADAVVLRLAARAVGGSSDAPIVWRNARLEGGGREPMTVLALSQLARRHAAANQKLLAQTERYLRAANATARTDDPATLQHAARAHDVDAAVLARWIDLLRLTPGVADTFTPDTDNAPPLTLLRRRLDANAPVTGWGQNEQSELPVVVSNSSDEERRVPGTVPPHRVTVHPMPREFVAVAWRAPIDGQLRVSGKVGDAHNACGNGFAWALEHRRGTQAQRLTGGGVDSGGSADVAPRIVNVLKDDQILLIVSARGHEHTCDLTHVDLTLTHLAEGAEARTWDLAAEVADRILEGNPLPDTAGEPDVWRFVMGPDPGDSAFTTVASRPVIPADSALGRWREAVLTGATIDRLDALAVDARKVLTGERPAESVGDRAVHALLTGMTTPLLGADPAAPADVDVEADARFGLPLDRFVAIDGRPTVDVAADAESVIEVRIPASLAQGREWVVDVEPGAEADDALMQVAVLTAAPQPGAALNDGRLIGGSTFTDADHRAAAFDAFRALFPVYLYKPDIVPTDEIISLRLFVREDDHLRRLLLDEAQRAELDRAWDELRFVSQQHLTEWKNFPVFMGFVSQDGDASYKRVDAKLREPVQARAEAFERWAREIEPVHLAAVVDFAAQAYRRPLTDGERDELRVLYRWLRETETEHEDAIRLTLARVLVAPQFLYRLEQPAPGPKAGPVGSYELATRLSYFLWSTMPDDELRAAAAAGALNDEAALTAQVRRMLADPRAEALAVEFAGQWLHFRDFADHAEKSETLFPMFDDALRGAMLRESVLFFDDLFRRDGSVLSILDADHTFLNARLAAHYGVPGIEGDHFRRVDGMKALGRGGALGLATILTKQSGASRTSPVLRGTWVVETLLGDKLPKPPADVPVLPDTAQATANLSARQLTERHRADPACSNCHAKIDPYGFALEAFDPIGRPRTTDANGHAIDTSVELINGTAFNGIDGLRGYLATQRREQFLRNFARKLLGYALGRSVTVSDELLIDRMLVRGEATGHRFSGYVETIVTSDQFRMIRGVDHPDEAAP